MLSLSVVSNGNKPVCLQWRKLVRHQQEEIVHHTFDLFTIQTVKVQVHSCMCVRSFSSFASLLLTALEQCLCICSGNGFADEKFCKFVKVLRIIRMFSIPTFVSAYFLVPNM